MSSPKRLLYKIPAGTQVSVEDLNGYVSRGIDKEIKHTTRKDLYFEEPAGTGWNFILTYFVYNERWKISVRTRLVEREEEA